MFVGNLWNLFLSDYFFFVTNMSHLCRIVPRAATNVFYVSRMNAHNLAPGTTVKVPEATGGHHIVSGSGQFIATDGPTATTRIGLGGGSSASMLPGAQTLDENTHSTQASGHGSNASSHE
jgi:hypothetical protein